MLSWRRMLELIQSWAHHVAISWLFTRAVYKRLQVLQMFNIKTKIHREREGLYPSRFTMCCTVAKRERGKIYVWNRYKPVLIEICQIKSREDQKYVRVPMFCAPPGQIKDQDVDARFCKLVQQLLDDHKDVVTMLAQGFRECRRHIQVNAAPPLLS